MLNRKPWDQSGQWDDISAGDNNNNNERLNNGSGSQAEDNDDAIHDDDDRVPPGQVHTADRCGRDIIQEANVSSLLFSFKVLCNHIGRATMGTAVNRSVGTAPAAIILPAEIYQAPLPRIHDTGIQTLSHLRRRGLES